MKVRTPELLAPAGNMEKLKAAILFGADAVYLGGKSFGLRAFSGNFSREELREAVEFAHEHGKRVYVTVNIYAHNADLEALEGYLEYLQEISVDALLIADLGVFRLAREIIPDMELHVSTQANITNWKSAEVWQSLGAKRIVLARELSAKEIREIRRHSDAELEMFVHGAMCISYSGRCYLSSYLTGRDANRGSCTQPCRWKYQLVEEKRPGQYFPVEEDERGSYIMNSKDLCLLPYLKEIIESGVDSLKIEGRMKSVHYVASVVKAYRMAIDSYFEAPDAFQVQREWLEELGKVSHRAYTSGFYLHPPTEEDQIYGTSSYEQSSKFVGLVRAYDEATGFATVEQRNHMKLGQEIEFFLPKGEGFRQKLEEMLDEEGNAIETAPHAQQILKIRTKKAVMPWTILRRDI